MDALARRGLARRSSGLVVSGGIFAILATAVVLLAPTLARQIGDVTSQLPRYLEGIRHWLATSSSTTVQQIARDLPEVHGGASP